MERKLNDLSPNELYSIAILLDYTDLLNFSDSSDRINRLVCERDPVWHYKLNTEFPNYDPKFNKTTPRETYEHIHRLLNLTKSIIKYTNTHYTDYKERFERELVTNYFKILSEEYGFNIYHVLLDLMKDDPRFRTVVKQLLDDRVIMNGFFDNSVYSIKDFLQDNNIVLDWDKFILN